MSLKDMNQEPFDVTSAEEARVAAADAEVRAQSRRHTRRSFVVGAVASAAGYGAYRYLDHGPESELIATPLRDALRFNASLSRGVFREHALAPTYPLSRAENLRLNGVVGLKKKLVMDSWRMQLVGVQDAQKHPRFVGDVTAWDYKYAANDDDDEAKQNHDTKTDPNAKPAVAAAPATPAEPLMDENHTGRAPRGTEGMGESDSTLLPHTPGLLLTIDDVKALPRHEMVTQFKCIEGWSQVVQWAGVRMADFMERYPPAPIDGKPPKYVYMETPDGDYFTGYDMISMQHPQTLLVTEMMGQPLTQLHGEPLRLHMPTKYGYKQIKCIGLIAYMNDKPDDFWTKLGYDWYAGL